MLLRESYNEKVYMIIEIFIGISVLVSFIVSILGYIELNFSSRALKDIKSSWGRYPILELINSRGCHDGFTPLISDQWAGTIEGCDCLNRWSEYIPWEYQNRLNRRSCDYNMTMGGCSRVSPVEPVNLEIWRNSFLCIKKLEQNYTELYRSAARSSKFCKNGYKQCGKLDTVGNLLCVQTSQKCPINKILIKDGQADPPADFNYTTILLGEQSKLYYTNEAIQENIIVDVKISEGDVCVDTMEHNTKFPGNSYILESDYNNYGCTKKIKESPFDNRYKKLDTYSKEDVYFENGLTRLLRILPEYPLSNLITDLEFYIRPYLGWKLYSSSSSGEDLETITEISSTLSTLSSLKLANMIFFIIVFIFFFIQVFTKWGNINLINFSETIFVTLSLVNLLLAILSLRLNNFAIDFENFDEGDQITNAIFSEFGSRVVSAHSKDVTLLVFSLANVGLYPSYMLCQYLGLFQNKITHDDAGDQFMK